MQNNFPTAHETSECVGGEGQGRLDPAGFPMDDEAHRLRVRAVANAQCDLVKALCRLIAETWRKSHPQDSSGDCGQHQS